MKRKQRNYEFCMANFKPAVGALAVLVVIIIGWTTWHCSTEAPARLGFVLSAAQKPPAKDISVKDKMLHPYWGNCNKCHITVDAGQPVSKVMAAAPISIKQDMLHKYWGNCLLCHKVTDGFQPTKAQLQARAKTAGTVWLTGRSLGLTLVPVTGAMMAKLGLAREDAVLVTAVAPGSIGEQADFRKGDEIVRVGKAGTTNINEFENALNKTAVPGDTLKFTIYRGKNTRNLHARLPNVLDNLSTAAARTPMTQNQIETRAEQLGVPKTQQSVTRALQAQRQAQAAGALYHGPVAVAVTGPHLTAQVASRFDSSPYFVVVDPARNAYKVVANPNANDAAGQGVQTGQLMVDLGVSNVIAGGYSTNALGTLHSLRINPFAGVAGPAQEAVNAYRAGTLKPLDVAAGHNPAGPGRISPPTNFGQKAQRQVVF
jgi:predicted Fe-Mo cluster-binding NifX family protein